jgi:hypothetical protein
MTAAEGSPGLGRVWWGSDADTRAARSRGPAALDLVRAMVQPARRGRAGEGGQASGLRTSSGKVRRTLACRGVARIAAGQSYETVHLQNEN